MNFKEFVKDNIISIIVTLIVILIILVLFLNEGDHLSFLNEPMNQFIAGSPDKRCINDSDCVIKRTTCQICDCGQIVYKNWQPYCPFKESDQVVVCEPCPPVNNLEIICFDYKCTTRTKKK